MLKPYLPLFLLLLAWNMNTVVALSRYFLVSEGRMLATIFQIMEYGLLVEISLP